MDIKKIDQALIALIEYFEAGNNESDAAAKAILVTDSKYDQYWLPEIKRFQEGCEWTGLRGPEAELLAGLLRQTKELIVDARK